MVSGYQLHHVHPQKPLHNKSSVVAEISDRGHNRHRPKRGGWLLCPFRGEDGSPSNTMWLGRGLLPYQVASSSIQPFGHNRHGLKIGWGAVPFFYGRSWVPIEHKVAWAEAYLHIKWHLSPSSHLATMDTGQKLGGGSCAPLEERELGSHLTQYCLG